MPLRHFWQDRTRLAFALMRCASGSRRAFLAHVAIDHQANGERRRSLAGRFGPVRTQARLSRVPHPPLRPQSSRCKAALPSTSQRWRVSQASTRLMCAHLRSWQQWTLSSSPAARARPSVYALRIPACSSLCAPLSPRAVRSGACAVSASADPNLARLQLRCPQRCVPWLSHDMLASVHSSWTCAPC